MTPAGGGAECDPELSSCSFHRSAASGSWQLSCVSAHVGMHICNLIPWFFTAYAVTCSSYKANAGGGEELLCNIFPIDRNNHMQDKAKAEYH